MNIDRIRTIIDDARRRDNAQFVSWVRSRMEGVGEPEVTATIDLAADYIDAAPRVLEQLVDVAERHGIEPVLRPLLDHVEGYFIDPLDLIPESQYNMAGLLDDAYLALSMVQAIGESGVPLVDVDLRRQNSVVRELLGEDFTARLDSSVTRARTEMLLGLIKEGDQILSLMQHVARTASESADANDTAVDRRLLGRWWHTMRISDGEISYSSRTFRILGEDGRFIEGSQALADAIGSTDNGTPNGWSQLSTRIPTGSRGWWRSNGTTLTLNYDNGVRADYQINLTSASLVLGSTTGEQELWKID